METAGVRSVGERYIAWLRRLDGIEDQRLERMSDDLDFECEWLDAGLHHIQTASRREFDILIGGEAHQCAVALGHTALDRECRTIDLAGAPVADHVVIDLGNNAGRHHQGCMGRQGQREERRSCQ